MPDYDPALLQPNQEFGGSSPPAAKKRGCGRLLLLGCGGTLVVLVGGVLLLFAFVFTMLKTSEPYKMAIKRVQDNKRAQEILGAPIQVGSWPTGSLTTEKGLRTAVLDIPVEGPKMKATLHVRAERPGDKWIFKKFALGIGTNGDEVDLLEESPPAGKDF